MLLLPRAHYIARCASHTATRIGCRYRAASTSNASISATAVLRRGSSSAERVRPFSTPGASAGREEATAATASTAEAAVTDGSADDAPKQILLYEAGSKVRKEAFSKPG